MMSFEIDVQTYQDLNIFQSSKSEFSVYSLFNKCKTVAGNQKIQEMMRSPTNDLDVLEKRTAAFNFLAENVFYLDISNEQLDLILHYLNYGKRKLRGNLIDALAIFIKNKFHETQDYYVVKIGLKYLLHLIKSCYSLCDYLQQPHAPIHLKDIGEEMQDIIEKLPLYKKRAFSIKPIKFYELSKLDSLIRTRENIILLHNLLDCVYRVDALQTIASMCSEKNFTLPKYLPGANKLSVNIDGIYHPAIPSAVKNDVTINHENHLTFLSGSNMAGKSSLLKSLGIAIYLAHIGFPVPASSMRTTIFNGLVTTINIADNVQNGLSHYLSEVLRVKYLLNTLVERQKIFVILDELFKGTNAKDASEATEIVVDGFSRIKNSAFIISSHITELADRFEKSNISLMHMEHLMVEDKPVFTYQIKKGVTKDGIGMFFIYNENIPSLLYDAEKASIK
ncbi:MutS-related protein [Pedobacter sp.]